MYAEAFPIRVPSDMLEALGAFTGHFWSDSLKLEPHVCAAIRAYINPAPPAQQQQLAAAPSDAGYQWKQVFLPEGTTLRASFDHKRYFAVVEGADIKYGEHAISRTVPRVPQEPVEQPAPQHSSRPQAYLRPASAPATEDGHEAQRKQGSGRSARRKRRAKKHRPRDL